jgi:hypothetical protein
MKQEAAQELMSGNGHDLLLAAVSIVPPAEGDAIVFGGNEPMVGNGDAMGVVLPDADWSMEILRLTEERIEGYYWRSLDHPVLQAELPE